VQSTYGFPCASFPYSGPSTDWKEGDNPVPATSKTSSFRTGFFIALTQLKKQL
jgi:hypothetical protein